MWTVGGNAVSHEVLGDLVVLAAGQEDAVGALDGAARAADLLVVGDRRARPLVVDDEAEVRLVEAHPERDRRHERLHLAGDQGVLERLALARSRGRRCRPGRRCPARRRKVATRCVSATVRQ